MAKILIIYASTDGQTEKICRHLQTLIEKQGEHVSLCPISDSLGLDLQPFNKIVIGASIRYGKHNPQVADFIKHNRTLLDSRPNAFFSVNLIARKPEKCRPEANPYLQKFLKRIDWRPKELAVFAGKLDYPSYGFLDRLMIRLIMRMTKGPTDPKTVIEFTDWQQVEEFGRLISKM